MFNRILVPLLYFLEERGLIYHFQDVNLREKLKILKLNSKYEIQSFPADIVFNVRSLIFALLISIILFILLSVVIILFVHSTYAFFILLPLPLVLFKLTRTLLRKNIDTLYDKLNENLEIELPRVILFLVIELSHKKVERAIEDALKKKDLIPHTYNHYYPIISELSSKSQLSKLLDFFIDYSPESTKNLWIKIKDAKSLGKNPSRAVMDYYNQIKERLSIIKRESLESYKGRGIGLILAIFFVLLIAGIFPLIAVMKEIPPFLAVFLTWLSPLIGYGLYNPIIKKLEKVF